MQKKITTPFIPEKVYENLPVILNNITKDFSGREKDIILTSSLGVLSSLLPNVFGYYDSSIVYTNLFTMVSSPPSSGK